MALGSFYGRAYAHAFGVGGGGSVYVELFASHFSWREGADEEVAVEAAVLHFEC